MGQRKRNPSRRGDRAIVRGQKSGQAPWGKTCRPALPASQKEGKDQGKLMVWWVWSPGARAAWCGARGPRKKVAQTHETYPLRSTKHLTDVREKRFVRGEDFLKFLDRAGAGLATNGRRRHDKKMPWRRGSGRGHAGGGGGGGVCGV